MQPVHKPKDQLIMDSLNAPTIYVSSLKKHCKSYCGLVNTHIRSMVWPILLGYTTPQLKNKLIIGDSLQTKMLMENQNYVIRGIENYDGIIDKDSDRSLFSLEHYGGMPENALQECKNMLGDMIKTFFEKHKELVYLQGVNDIFSILMMVMGPQYGCVCSEALMLSHFIDAVDTQFDLMKYMKSTYYIIEMCDPELAKYLGRSENIGFIIKWVITWFVHTEKTDGLIERIFDYFIASHPTAVFYISAASIIFNRSKLLRTQNTFENIFCLFQEFEVHDIYTFDCLIQEAKLLKSKISKGDLINYIKSLQKQGANRSAFIREAPLKALLKDIYK